ncbi:hypothetical protein D0C36_02170 [Mucilaginibacter conchicola]|uniref:Carboxypeptidase regulatory-like domain-containing protein n=1 Tax=Mucilaginibacter conchicola TaxID=2303333 RepID=A0A372NW83_9SPHI|nr:hypothetical protein [Mucilaginibacter conchicola]RFZ94383.1 hypothetical protein D0C36_02170 [Mucilaginibacter conchicola]
MKNLLLLAIIIFATIGGYAQQSAPAVDALINKLKDIAENHATEKVYLSFDKPVYKTGDTIYFKAFVTLGDKHLPSTLSNVLHVDLINLTNKSTNHVKLRIKEGTAWGDFTLPDSLNPQDYAIRGYTAWMKNEGNYFYKRLTLSQPPAVKLSAQSKTPAPDLQFFPEGGYLVADIDTKIAFKALAYNGKGINLKGRIVDDAGKQVAEINSTHLGMGSFTFKAKNGVGYKAVVTFNDNREYIYQLPTTVSKGISLAVDNTMPDSARISITSNRPYFRDNRNKVHTLLIYSQGLIKTVPCTLDTALITLDVATKKLASGIVQVVLLSPEGQILAHRRLFVFGNNDLTLHLDKDSVGSSTVLSVTNTNTANFRANFSVSILGGLKPDEGGEAGSNIMSYLLLSSDLKGYIEDPDYYFRSRSLQSRQHLDLVMLTHGYNKWSWNELFKYGQGPAKFPAEKGFSISGLVKDMAGNALYNATVMLFTKDLKVVNEQVTDKQGSFSFNDLDLPDTAFVLKALSAKGSDKLKITYTEKAEQLPDTGMDELANVYNAMVDSTKKIPADISRKTKRTLQEVTITAKKTAKLEMTPMGLPDQVISGDKFDSDGQMMAKLMGRLRNVDFIWDQTKNIFRMKSRHIYRGIMKVYVNDMEMQDDFNINNIDPHVVETVTAFTNPTTGAGAVVIKTNRARLFKNDPSKGITPVSVAGYYNAREFYVPKFVAAESFDKPKTLFWNANLQFFNNDKQILNLPQIKTKSTLIIEGMANDGRLVYEAFNL